MPELATPRREDLLEQVVAADGLDRREQPGGEALVVGREEVLRLGGDVVQVARPPDAVADGLAADEAGRLERPQLLEDAGPAGTKPGGQLVGRARAIDPQPQQQVAPETRWSADGRWLGRRPGVRRCRQLGLGHGDRLAPVTAARSRGVGSEDGLRPLARAPSPARHRPRVHGRRGRPDRRRARTRASIPDRGGRQDRRARLARDPDPRGRGRRRASTRWPTRSRSRRSGGSGARSG